MLIFFKHTEFSGTVQKSYQLSEHLKTKLEIAYMVHIWGHFKTTNLYNTYMVLGYVVCTVSLPEHFKDSANISERHR